MFKSFLCAVLVVSHVSFAVAQAPLWQGNGRIIVSADGNEHDHDDWAGTPLSLAIIASQNLQDRVPLYIYSDHIWGSNQEHPGVDGVTPYDQMKRSAIDGGRMFGFTSTRFLCAVDNAEVAYEALKAEINESTQDNPLFIVVAGPVQVIGEALARAETKPKGHVTVISTKDAWNNKHADAPYGGWDIHAGWTLDEIKQRSSEMNDGLKIVTITNQNPCLNRKWSEYDWLRTAPERNHPYYKEGSWNWLFDRLCMSIKPVSGKENFYAIDPSDAGKVIFLLTGTEDTSPQLCYELMRDPRSSSESRRVAPRP